MMVARVDVVIPCFNAARFLPQTLDSVLCQTFPGARAVVVDDGSTDDLLGVLAKYNGRVDLIRKTNGGQASARNLGVRETTGEFVCLLDADDLIRPTMLERLVAHLEAHPNTDVAYAKTLAFNGDDSSRLFAEHWRPFVSWNDLLAPLSLFCAMHGSATLLRRRVFERAGFLPEARSLQGCEDWHFWLQLRLSGARIDYVPEVLTLYRAHAAASSSDEVSLARREAALLEAASQLFDAHLDAADRRRLLLAIGIRNIASRWQVLGEWREFERLTSLATTVCARVDDAKALQPMLTGAADSVPIELAATLLRLEQPVLALVVLVKECHRGHIVARAKRARLEHSLEALLEQAQQFVLATERSRSAQSTEPDFAGHVAHSIAAILLERGQTREALSWLSRALVLNPHQWASRALEVQALVAAGHFGDAAEQLANALNAGPAPIARQFARNLYHFVEFRSGSSRGALRAMRGLTAGTLGRYFR